MKRRSLSESSRHLLLSLALISMAFLAFGCGKTGDTGPQGPPGPAGSSGSTTGTVSGNVKNAISQNPVSAAAVTTSPTVQGVTNITTDASGNYSMNLPNGSYTLTFAKNGYTSQTTATINVVATKTITTNITLVPLAGATVNAGVDKTNQAFGAAVPLKATVEVYDPSLTGPQTFCWQQITDPTLPPTTPPSGVPPATGHCGNPTPLLTWLLSPALTPRLLR